MAEIWTVQKALNWTVQYFQSQQLPDARLSAELLLAHVLGCQRIDLYLQFERILTPQERAAYRELIQRRARREPLQYLLGSTEFYGLRFEVRKGVFIPRPETELLVDRVLEFCQQNGLTSPDLLDVGTGSGCIAIALAKHLPRARVWAIDVSREAVELAKRNAEQLGAKVNILQMDFSTFCQKSSTRFDGVVSNPPYIGTRQAHLVAEEVKHYEPAQAIWSGENGLAFIQEFFARIHTILKPGGFIGLEIGAGQYPMVRQLCLEHGFQPMVYTDYQNIERVVIASYEQQK